MCIFPELLTTLDGKSRLQVPTMCLMTSGGGFRAMIAYAGAYRAMARLGIVDAVTYIAALSGSSWSGTSCVQSAQGITLHFFPRQVSLDAVQPPRLPA